MHLVRLSSSLSLPEIETALKNHAALALDAAKIHSGGEIALAYALAQKSFRQKTNLANQMRFEFLLWLAGTRDIRRALRELGAQDPSDFLLISWEPLPRLLPVLRAKKKKTALSPRADWASLERISLSRV